MGQNAYTDRPRRGYITIDWMVSAVSCIALLFLLGTLLRTSGAADVVSARGFHDLRQGDTLLAYQDFSFEAAGWNRSETSDRLPGIGPVLGPFSGEPVQRSFAMPADANAARVCFDLHLMGDWAGETGFTVALGDQQVLIVTLPEGAEPEALEFQVNESNTLAVAVQTAAVTPRQGEASLPGASDDFVTVSVRLSVTEPMETLALRLHADVEGDAQWTLDNFTFVANAGDL